MGKRKRSPRRAEMTQPVTVGGMRMCDQACGYEYRLLTSTALETDTSYQRRIDDELVGKIVANFDPRVANTLKVSYRDGRFFVFDGAHTLLALKRVQGDAPFLVDCKVYFGLTYEDEAYLFALQTGVSKDVAFGVRLRAMLISKSAEAEDFRTHTANAGLSLVDGSSSASKHTIAALAKAYRLYKDRGAEEYERMLRLIVDAWDGAAWSLTSYILGGVGTFLKEYGEAVSRERFVKRLRGVGYEELRDEARRQQRSSSDIAHALAIVKAYNRSGGRGTLDPRALTIQD
jgi:hypothetical protein